MFYIFLFINISKNFFLNCILIKSSTSQSNEIVLQTEANFISFSPHFQLIISQSLFSQDLPVYLRTEAKKEEKIPIQSYKQIMWRETLPAEELYKVRISGARSYQTKGR